MVTVLWIAWSVWHSHLLYTMICLQSCSLTPSSPRRKLWGRIFQDGAPDRWEAGGHPVPLLKVSGVQLPPFPAVSLRSASGPSQLGPKHLKP